jgi:hypothetical protein
MVNNNKNVSSSDAIDSIIFKLKCIRWNSAPGVIED